MALLQHASLEIRSHDKFSLICGLVGFDTHIIQVFSPESIAYTDNPAASRLPYVSPTDIVYRLPPYVRHPPYSVDLRFTAAPTRSNFSVTLRAWLLWEDHFIIKCLQYVKELFVFVLFELFIVPFNVYI